MHQFTAMNTEFLVAGLSESAALWVEEKIRKAEGRLSRFQPESEISRLNARTKQEAPLSPLLAALLADALDYHRETEGIFSPFLGKNLAALGYDRSFEKLSIQRENQSLSITPQGIQGVLPLEQEIRQTGILRLDPSHSIDLGGFAKGWLAQRAADHCRVAGYPRGVIDAGGDIAVWGQSESEGPWCLGVAHPFFPEKDLALLWPNRPMAIATSSVLKRSWQREGRVFHHLLDPRTGEPATSDLVQATVLAPHLALAEVYTKVLLILGSEAGPRQLSLKRPELAFLAVDRQGRVLHSNNLDAYCAPWEVMKS